MKAAVRIGTQQFIGANFIITLLSLLTQSFHRTVKVSYFTVISPQYVTYSAFNLHGKRTLASNVAGNRVSEWGGLGIHRAYKRREITWNVI